MAGQRHSLPGFVPYAKDRSGSTKTYINEKTGEQISRRQFVERARELETGRKESLEKTAKFNREIEPEKAVLRSARGRKGVTKLPPKEQARIAALRKATEEAKKKKARELAEQKKAARKIEQQRRKQSHAPKKISGSLLQPGKRNRRISFGAYDDLGESYAEYLRIYQDAKKQKIIIGYAMGMTGYHSDTGVPLTPTLWRFRLFDRPISESEFVDMAESFVEEHSYFEPNYFWLLLAFDESYAKQRAERAGKVRRNRT